MIDVFQYQNIKSFYEKLHAESLPLLENLKDDPVVLANISSTLEGKGISNRKSNNIKLTNWQKSIHLIHSPFSDAINSIDTVDMISILVKQYPNYKSYKINKITKTKYLRYHIENFLNEVYIFEQRILQLLREIEKLCDKYKKGSIHNITILRSEVSTALSSVRTARGNHVHRERFNDDRLDRLSFLELMSNSEEMKDVMNDLNHLIYRQDRLKWSKDIANSAIGMTKVLDHVLKTVQPIYFEELHQLMNSNKIDKESRLR